MKTVFTLALGLAACLGLAANAQDKKDAPKIEGTWTLVSGKKMGTDVDDMSKKAKYIIGKDKITIDGGDGKFVMGYKLDPKNPMNIDMEILEGPIEGVKGMKAQGIIEVKGDDLKLAYSTEKDMRPKDFAGKDGNAFTFKRAKDK